MVAVKGLYWLLLTSLYTCKWCTCKPSFISPFCQSDINDSATLLVTVMVTSVLIQGHKSLYQIFVIILDDLAPMILFKDTHFISSRTSVYIFAHNPCHSIWGLFARPLWSKDNRAEQQSDNLGKHITRYILALNNKLEQKKIYIEWHDHTVSRSVMIIQVSYSKTIKLSFMHNLIIIADARRNNEKWHFNVVLR